MMSSQRYPLTECRRPTEGCVNRDMAPLPKMRQEDKDAGEGRHRVVPFPAVLSQVQTGIPCKCEKQRVRSRCRVRRIDAILFAA